MPTRQRALASWFITTFHASVDRASRLAGFRRSGRYKPSVACDQTALRLRIRDIAHARPRFGYQRIWALLRREGWCVNKMRARCLYRLAGLQLRMHVRRRKHMALHRGAVPVPTGLQRRWRWTSFNNQLIDGRAFRALTVVDQWSRQSPLLEGRFSLTGKRVVGAFAHHIPPAQLPQSLTVDHGTEFTSKALEAWAFYRGVPLDFTRPGKPTDTVTSNRLTARARRVSERASISVAGPHETRHRSVAKRLQLTPSA